MLLKRSLTLQRVNIRIFHYTFEKTHDIEMKQDNCVGQQCLISISLSSKRCEYKLHVTVKKRSIQNEKEIKFTEYSEIKTECQLTEIIFRLYLVIINNDGRSIALFVIKMDLKRQLNNNTHAVNIHNKRNVVVEEEDDVRNCIDNNKNQETQNKIYLLTTKYIRFH